ncbi:Rop family plasmid primer RNA-binding protein [Erwinia amylovora]
MIKQDTTALNMAKFIRGQTLRLIEKLNPFDLDDKLADCEKLYEQAEALYQKQSGHQPSLLEVSVRYYRGISA